MGRRYSDEQIIGILKEFEARVKVGVKAGVKVGIKAAELCRKYGMFNLRNRHS